MDLFDCDFDSDSDSDSESDDDDFGMSWQKDDRLFKEDFRMERSDFSWLVNRLECLGKKEMNYRKGMPLDMMIVIALYTLGSTAEYRVLGNLFRVDPSTVSKILYEFCVAVVKELTAEYMTSKFLTESNIDECVQGFEAMGFPQCLGAIDTCHIEVEPAAEEAESLRNSRGWCSLVLMALVDFRSRFIYVNIGAPGCWKDTLVFEKSNLCKMLDSCSLLEEKSKKLCDVDVPVVLIGDSAFRFSRQLMKPYSISIKTPGWKNNFNNNLVKSSRVVENAFLHLKARFRRLAFGIEYHQKRNSVIIMACCVLHNILNIKNSVIEDTWKAEMDVADLRQPNLSSTAGNYNKSAEKVRSAIAEFLLK